jgi:para-nitrobenzyl esterase
MTELQYQQVIQMMYPPALANAILAEYPASDYPTPRRAFIAVTTDSRFTCPARRVARAAAAGQSEPVWRYFFTRAPGPLGAAHAIEIPYLFHTMDTIEGFVPDATDEAVSETMGARWTAFAATGDPGGGWPEYLDDGSDLHLVIDEPATAGDGIRTDHCDFWEPFF